MFLENQHGLASFARSGSRYVISIPHCFGDATISLSPAEALSLRQSLAASLRKMKALALVDSLLKETKK